MTKGTSVLDRFWAFVDKTDGCWVWKGVINNTGYGHFSVNGRYRIAHRWAYENFVGPIPEGLEIDHLCNVRACVNPGHLEAVTPQENLHRRKAARHDCASKVQGVHQNGKNWSVRFTRYGVKHYFGTYGTVAEAAAVAQAAKAKLDANP